MKRNETKLEARARYVKDRINNRAGKEITMTINYKSHNVSDEVRRIARELFVSEATIWRDLRG